MIGALARKLWTAEQLIRDNKWGFWHPYCRSWGMRSLARHRNHRYGPHWLALIKKCAGFDMNILCYDPAYQNHSYVQAIQETNDLRHARGISHQKNLDQVRRSGPGSRVGRLRQCPRPFAERRREPYSDIPSVQRADAWEDETHRLSGEHLAWSCHRPRLHWPKLYAKGGLPGPLLTCMRKSSSADSPLRDSAIEDRCRLYPHFASAAKSPVFPSIRRKAWRDDVFQGLTDVLEGNYGATSHKCPT